MFPQAVHTDHPAPDQPANTDTRSENNRTDRRDVLPAKHVMVQRKPARGKRVGNWTSNQRQERLEHEPSPEVFFDQRVNPGENTHQTMYTPTE
ncbi:MAG: hypothetical protein R3E58_01705 [Phycisphaerae bacterium]